LFALLLYLLDIFDNLNGLNFFLRGANATVLQLLDKVSAFVKKDDAMVNPCQGDTLEIFVNVSECLDEND
jgi:hypothetical protein